MKPKRLQLDLESISRPDLLLCRKGWPHLNVLKNALSVCGMCWVEPGRFNFICQKILASLSKVLFGCGTAQMMEWFR